MSSVFSKAVIAGGTGFLGQALAKSFHSEGVEVVVLTRNLEQESSLYGRLVKWDAKTLDSWMSELDRADLLINLTGRSIDCRHTKRNKDLILRSRIDSTKILGEACSVLNHPPRVWMNASTATVYEDIRGDLQPHDELSDPFAKGFSEDVGRKWEDAFFYQCELALFWVMMVGLFLFCVILQKLDLVVNRVAGINGSVGCTLMTG